MENGEWSESKVVCFETLFFGEFYDGFSILRLGFGRIVLDGDDWLRRATGFIDDGR